MIAAVWQILFHSLGAWPWAAVVPCYVLAQLRGDLSGRGLTGLLAITAAVGFLITTAAASVHPAKTDYQARFGLDTLLLAALVVIGLRSVRIYTIIIAAAQLLAVMLDAIAASRFAVRSGTHMVLLFGVALMQISVFG